MVAAFSKPSLASPTITSAPAAATMSPSATFAFTGPSGATFKCGLDGGTPVVCPSPQSYTVAEGPHVFNVVSVKGSEVSAPTTFSWAVDTAAPGLPTITSKPADPANSTSASFSFSGPEANLRYACVLDGAAYSTCTTPKSYSSLSQGSHTFAVRATDAAGNTGASTTWTWRVDTVAPPAPALTTKPSNPTSNATNDFDWTSVESGVTSECSLENGAWFTCTRPYRWVINTGNYGQHQFAVRSRDTAGNASAATQYTFKYEKGLPTSGIPFKIEGSVSGLWIGVSAEHRRQGHQPEPGRDLCLRAHRRRGRRHTPSGCTTADDLELQQSDISAANTLIVPANDSVVLPEQGVAAPRIRLKDLPTVNQDICKNKSFALSYSGTATN